MFVSLSVYFFLFAARARESVQKTACQMIVIAIDSDAFRLLFDQYFDLRCVFFLHISPCYTFVSRIDSGEAKKTRTQTHKRKMEKRHQATKMCFRMTERTNERQCRKISGNFSEHILIEQNQKSFVCVCVTSSSTFSISSKCWAEWLKKKHAQQMRMLAGAIFVFLLLNVAGLIRWFFRRRHRR